MDNLPTHNRKSLQTGILIRLVIPLIGFVLIDAVLSYFVTLHYVDKAYDRWLLDSADSLTQEIKVQNSKVIAELPPAALEIFKWDEDDKTYFKIISTEREVIAGDKQVPEPFASNTDWSHPVFFYDQLYGEPVRVVSTLIKLPNSTETVFIHVAETTNKRRAMMTDILLADLLPQIGLVLVVSLFLLSGLKHGLKPLHHLAEKIAGRRSRDLTPIPDQQVFMEVRTLTDTINELLIHHQQAIDTQQRFISNAAHQLRTPLAGLKLQAERALREQDLNALQPALQQIQNCADRLSHLTTQLLVLAKSEPLHGSHTLEPVDLCEIAKNTCIDWVPKALQRHIDISLEGTDAPLIINGDAILLGELIGNLLDNAIAYGNEGGNIRVQLNRYLNPSLSIEDDGPGIPEAEMEKICERFYRIAGSGGDGCGLGLAIVKEISELHGASLHISRANAHGGTRINLRFAD